MPVRWQNAVGQLRMHQNGAVATEMTHKHAKLKNHIVAHGLMRRASCLDNVFELRDGDGEIQLLDGLLQDFERIATRPEDALSPHRWKHVMLQTAGNFVGHVQSFD